MAPVGEASAFGPRPHYLPSVGTAVVISGVSVIAAAWIASLLLARADGLATPAYDQAFFQQLVWRVGEDGAWLTSFDAGSFLGLHFSPILVVPALLERGLWLDARLLSLLHAMTVAALAPAGFLFLRAALRPSRHAGLVALGLALPIPAWAVTQQVIRADFHPEVAGVVLALVAGWAALTGRGAATWVLAALALSTREDVTYAVFVVGLATWGLAHGRARRRGAAMAIVAAAWAVIVFGILMPIARDGAIVDTAVYYRWLGSGPGILLAPFRMPDRVIAALTQDRTWFKVAGLLVSLAGLPLLRPRWLLLLAPPLAAVLLSHHPPQALLLLQYPIILVAPALIAAAFGARRALALLGRHARRPGGASALRVVGVVGLAGPALVVAVVQGSVPPFDQGAAAPYHRPAAIGTVRTIARSVPPDALLVVDEGLAAPLASRSEIRLVNRNPRNIAEGYVLLDADAWSPSSWASASRERAIARIRGEDRRVIAADGRFTLLGPVSSEAP